MGMENDPDVGSSAHHHGVQRRHGRIWNSAWRDSDESCLQVADAHIARGAMDDAACQGFQSDLDHLLPQTLEQHSPLYSLSVSRYRLKQTRYARPRRDRWLAR